jgi:hypothetical protein
LVVPKKELSSMVFSIVQPFRALVCIHFHNSPFYPS